MASSNDKFVSAILDLLDKLIDHETKTSQYLTEIKLNVENYKSNFEKISDKIDKIDKNIIDEIYNIFNKITLINGEIDKNSFLQSSSQKEIEEIRKILLEFSEELKKDKERNEMNNKIVHEVYSFIRSAKSKKAWVGLAVAAIAGIATVSNSIFDIGSKIFGWSSVSVQIIDDYPNDGDFANAYPIMFNNNNIATLNGTLSGIKDSDLFKISPISDGKITLYIDSSDPVDIAIANSSNIIIKQEDLKKKNLDFEVKGNIVYFITISQKTNKIVNYSVFVTKN